MKKEFEEYLIGLGMKGSLTNKVENIMNFFEENFSEEIIDIFVEEYIKKDGSREYESLEFFSEKYIFEAKNFMITDENIFWSFVDSFTYIRLIRENYDFKQTNQSSRFSLHCGTDKNAIFNLKSSQENCDHLKEILMRYIKPNLKIKL
jgi:hypothetical protein